jgi:hypothetical protein
MIGNRVRLKKDRTGVIWEDFQTAHAAGRLNYTVHEAKAGEEGVVVEGIFAVKLDNGIEIGCVGNDFIDPDEEFKETFEFILGYPIMKVKLKGYAYGHHYDEEYDCNLVKRTDTEAVFATTNTTPSHEIKVSCRYASGKLNADDDIVCTFSFDGNAAMALYREEKGVICITPHEY